MIYRITGFFLGFVVLAVAMNENFKLIIDYAAFFIVIGFTLCLFLISHKKGMTRRDTLINLKRYFMYSGWLGFLLGIIIMLANIDDPDALGPAIAISLLTVLYGCIFAYISDALAHSYTESKLESTYDLVKVIKKSFLVLGAISVFLCIILLGAYYVAKKQANIPYKQNTGTGTDKNDLAKKIRGPIMALHYIPVSDGNEYDFEITIHDKAKEHTLRFNMYLGVQKGNYKLHENIYKMLPQIREIIILNMGNKPPSELHISKIPRIKDELTGKINESLSSGNVIDIVFSSYILDLIS